MKTLCKCAKKLRRQDKTTYIIGKSSCLICKGRGELKPCAVCAGAGMVPGNEVCSGCAGRGKVAA